MNTLQGTAKISVPRVRWLYLGGRRMLLIMAACFFVGLVLLRVGVFLWNSNKHASLATLRTFAQVTDKGHRLQSPKDEPGDLRPVYWLRYHYRDAEGYSHENRVTLDQSDWSRYQKYDAILIDYQRDRPEQSRPAEAAATALRWATTMSLTMGGLLYLGSCVWAVGGWVWATQKARRVASGTPVLGEVTERASPLWARLTSPAWYRLQFEFTDAHGHTQSGKTHWLTEDIACYWSDGDSILVLCDPRQRARPEADVFQVRQDDKERLLDGCREIFQGSQPLCRLRSR